MTDKKITVDENLLKRLIIVFNWNDKGNYRNVDNHIRLIGIINELEQEIKNNE